MGAFGLAFYVVTICFASFGALADGTLNDADVGDGAIAEIGVDALNDFAKGILHVKRHVAFDPQFEGDAARGFVGAAYGLVGICGQIALVARLFFWRARPCHFFGTGIAGKVRPDNGWPVGDQRHVGKALFGQHLAGDFWQKTADRARAFSACSKVRHL